MPGSMRYTPQSGNSNRAAKSAARSEPSATPAPAPRQPQQRNVEPVLALGATRYITIERLGTFCILPVSFKAGQRVLSLYSDILVDIQTAARTGDKDVTLRYYQNLGRLAAVLWQNIRPIKFRRWLWKFGLMQNPFLQCTELELREITNFFLQGRMKSSVQSISEQDLRNRA